MDALKLSETLQEAGLSTRAALTVVSEATKVEETRDELRHAAEWLARDMTRLVEKLGTERESCVNSLGEVQGMGATVDRACALLAERTRSLATLCRALGVDTALVGL